MQTAQWNKSVVASHLLVIVIHRKKEFLLRPFFLFCLPKSKAADFGERIDDDDDDEDLTDLRRRIKLTQEEEEEEKDKKQSSEVQSGFRHLYR